MLRREVVSLGRPRLADYAMAEVPELVTRSARILIRDYHM